MNPNTADSLAQLTPVSKKRLWMDLFVNVSLRRLPSSLGLPSEDDGRFGVNLLRQ